MTCSKEVWSSDVTINSADRERGTPVKYRIDLNRNIIDAVEVQLLQMSGNYIGHTVKVETNYTVRYYRLYTLSSTYSYADYTFNIPVGTYTMDELLKILNCTAYVRFEQAEANGFITIKYVRPQLEDGVFQMIYCTGFSSPVNPGVNDNLYTDINEIIGFPQGWRITATDGLAIRSLASVNTDIAANSSAAITIEEFATNSTSTGGKSHTFVVPLNLGSTVDPKEGTFNFTRNSNFPQVVYLNKFSGNMLTVTISDIKTGSILAGIGEHQLVLQFKTIQ